MRLPKSALLWRFDKRKSSAKKNGAFLFRNSQTAINTPRTVWTCGVGGFFQMIWPQFDGCAHE